MKTILLTGATGFLGSHLLDALLKNDYEVIVLKRSMSDTWRIESHLDEFKSYDIDTLELDQVFKENSIHTIIHMATLYRKSDNGIDIDEMISSNITFPTTLLEIGIKNGLKAFINTGTFFECDCSILPVTESSKPKAFNLYAKTKQAFETILATYANQINIITLRLFSPYGEKDNDKLIPMVIKKALDNEVINLSDGLQKLDFIYSNDIVAAYLKAIEKLEKQSSGYQLYNIGFGTAVSVREVVSILEQKLGRVIEVVWGAPSSYDIPFVWADISKAKKDLEWVPEIDIHAGLDKMLEYYKRIV